MSDAAFPESSSRTKITYIDGRAATITLRRCRLEVVRDDRVESRVFDGDVITVGATDDNDLILSDDTVSRNHCRIYREGDSFIVKDLESTNGTFINRVRIKEAWLKQGCTLSLGKTEMRFAPVEEKVQIVPSDKQRFGELIGRNARMREIYAILEKIAPTDATVVIEGETGTGKEVVARALHQASLRKGKPFMIFDCGAVPENLIESELFGHEKGAFTGAVATRQGVFEMANGGTVFLDELGELALDLQPKLLRVLEQRELKRVGGSRSFKVDVRIVAATNRELQEEVRLGRFREDLYYRLSVVRLGLPPLRERKEDIPILVKHFLRSGKYNRSADGTRLVRDIGRPALDRLLEYDWPGNVRELSNVVERAVSFADGDIIAPQDLPDYVAGKRAGGPPVSEDTNVETKVPVVKEAPDVAGPFKHAKESWVASFERDYIASLLERNDGNISHAAREAEIDRKYFRKLMKKYEITA